MHPSPFFNGDGSMDVSGFQSTYLWVIVLGSMAAFLMAFGIGANDVANAFGTSIGAKALTLKQAVLLAAIFETLGAALLGAGVADTVRKGIIDMDYFNLNPELLMIAMACSLFASGLWLVFCSAYGLPVSTTHSILGALVGLGLTINPASVQWGPLGWIVLFWFFAPVISGVLTSICFLTFRTFILRAKNAPERAFKSYPIILVLLYLAVVFTLGVKIPFIPLRKFVKAKLAEPESCALVILSFFGLAVLFALITWLATYKWMKRRMNRMTEDDVTGKFRELEEAAALEAGLPEDASGKSDSTRSTPAAVSEMVTDQNLPALTLEGAKKSKWAFDMDLDEEIMEDEKVKKMHANAERFDPKTEEVYTVMMVIGNCFHSLAHGSNDVANAIGPFAAMFYIYKEAKVSSEVEMDWWIPVAGGLVIAIGLLTYGYRTLLTMGVKLATITASRGFSIEIGATVTILLGSFFKLPLSSTHCSVGSTIGAGLCESARPWRFEGVNIGLLVKVMWGWICTLLFTGFLSMVLCTIFSVSYFPRSEPYACVAMQSSNSFNSTLTGLLPAYGSTTSELKAALEDSFNNWKVDDEEDLSRKMLEKYYSKAETDLILSTYSKGKDKMTKKQWLKWRCYNDQGFLRTTDLHCNPLCTDARTPTVGMKKSVARCGLVLSEQEYALSSQYLVSACE